MLGKCSAVVMVPRLERCEEWSGVEHTSEYGNGMQSTLSILT